MKHNSAFSLLLLSISLFSCGNGNLEFRRSSTKDVDEIDTIGRLPERDIFVLGFVRNGALGHFTYDLAIVKNYSDALRQPLIYEMENGKKRFRVTREHIVLLGDIDTDTVGKWSKGDILNAIDSASLLKQHPMKLNFKATY